MFSVIQQHFIAEIFLQNRVANIANPFADCFQENLSPMME
jgi:hypothetical protein